MYSNVLFNSELDYYEVAKPEFIVSVYLMGNIV